MTSFLAALKAPLQAARWPQHRQLRAQEGAEFDEVSRIGLEPGSFVEVGDADRFADLLFSVDVAGRRAFLYLLFEHQSGVERFMVLRTLGYMLRKWERCLSESPRLEFLPPVIPIVLHHSESGWTAPVAMHELFDWSALPQSELRPFLPDFRFLLDDLSHKTDAELLARATGEAERGVPSGSRPASLPGQVLWPKPSKRRRARRPFEPF